VWAVGVVLYELLSGVCPYDGPNEQAVILKIVSDPPPRIERAVEGIPDRLAAIMKRALEPELADRYPSMRELRDDLIELAGGSRRVLSAPPGRLSTPPPIAPPGPAAPLRGLIRGEGYRGGRAPSSHDIGEQWLDPDDLVAIEEGPPSKEESSVTRARAALVPRDEMDWDYDRTMQLPPAPDVDADAAEHALAVNKLREAIAHAARALAARGRPDDIVGRMLLVQAIAHRWLGDYTASERCALEATRRLAHGSGAWYAALGYLVIASGCLGKGQQLLASFEEVRKLEVTDDRRSLHVIILCRLAIFLLRVGLPSVAHQVSLDAEDLVGGDEAVDSIVRAWLDAARAEVAMHRGDLTTYLRRIESAVESFTVRGDVRNACLQRANIGNAYMQLGAYRRAVGVLEEALRVAEPMELDLVAGVKVNLGFALAQLGQLDRGIEVEAAALAHCVRQNYKRFEACSRVYLATMHLFRGEVDPAASIARQAIDGLDGGSAIRAYALGTMARVMLTQRQSALALRYAQEGFDLMNSLGGVEEGESLIRAVYALALQATGKEAEGRRQIAEARLRLLDRAGRINDAHWRQSFLEGVPDNAWAMRLAADWVGAEGAADRPGAAR
jgi:tetratricopeptide (TPR) repeat protein